MKSLYEEVEGALDEEDEDTPGIRVLLSRFILQELVRVSEIFTDALDPTGEEMIKNIHTDLFLKDTAFCQGSLDEYSGFDVWTGEDGGSFRKGSGYAKQYTVNSWSPAAKSTNNDRKAGYTPFRLETYVRVVEKDGCTGFESFDSRPDTDKGVLSLMRFRNLGTDYGVASEPLSALFSSVRVGMRLCLQTPDTTDTVAITQITNSTDTLENAFEASMSEISDRVMQQEKAFRVVSFDGTQYLVPLAASEIDFDLEQYESYQAMVDENYPETFLNENVECLARN